MVLLSMLQHVCKEALHVLRDDIYDKVSTACDRTETVFTKGVDDAETVQIYDITGCHVLQPGSKDGNKDGGGMTQKAIFNPLEAFIVTPPSGVGERLQV